MRPAPDARTAWRAVAPAATTLALLGAIGVELAVVAAWLPDTLRAFWSGGPGDFRNLYEPASHLRLVGLYSPALTLLLYPFSFVGEHIAYRVVFGLDAAAALAVAYVAQRAVRSPEARLAVALAVLSLPELHWALRLGHVTPMLALAALGGLLLVQRRPRLGAALLAVLSIKPQYVIAPFLYLACRRQFRELGVMFGVAAAGAAAGFAVIGPQSVATFAGSYLNWGPRSTENLLPVQQAWMYSWPGFLVSAGVKPNPLLTADLLVLSAGVAAVSVWRLDAAKGAAVAALAMVLVTPYSQFYDACLVAVAMALVLRAGIQPAAAGGIVAALYAAAVVTQTNTYFPVRNVLGPAATAGLYWITPALLAAIVAIAFADGLARRRARKGA
ncbi:MAG: glycosyltransferase family 87 protein [Dehalococcoidia bacterium]